MFDRDRFSLARFSLGSDESIVPIKETFLESLNSSAGASVPVITAVQFNESFNRIVQCTVSVGVLFRVAEDFSTICIPSAGVVISFVQVDTLNARTNAIKTIYIEDSDGAQLVGDVYLSKNIPESISDDGKFGSKFHGAKNIDINATLFDSLATVFEANTQSLKSTLIQVSIPPGGELRIDSGTYTVSLDGENVLHTQTGEWIMITPGTYRITVETAEGGSLEGQLIYTEKYL